ncbi:hypothetical protein LPB86_03465 [Pedobacter sp. MC2016-14]|uniref:hypothetical protein n=1 Tax=Pedobacter sp. MC2016-14 TaxID=2897327 RepID=UPI001E4804B3|nr:hypothetical protein [Pedobacter sp. MC2016-14]MCD0487271.1 hypothetical protein [Pedobacter sp. MC2016-14]
MALKSIVDDLLLSKNRSLTWLSKEMSKTFDGLKLSLNKETLKYKDLILMAKVLEVHPAMLFKSDSVVNYGNNDTYPMLSEEEAKYSDLKGNLKNCREMVSALKDQIKDKEKIIILLSKDS